MFDTIPAGVDPSGFDAESRIEQMRESLQLHASDEHAALVEAVANYTKSIIMQYTDVPATSISYKYDATEFGVGALVFSVPEEMPAIIDIVTQAVEPFRGDEFIELREEGTDVQYDMPQDYTYVFHYSAN